MSPGAASPPELPATLPIFPLDGVLLLPHGHLPLHIFEPRYRAMIEAALGERRLIGMIQPRRDYPHPIPDDARIFDVGCAGRIVSFAETDDGRFLVTLRGVCRFRVDEELPLEANGFRRVRPDFVPYLGDFDADDEATVERGRLLEAARHYLQVKNISCDWQAVEAASLPALITSLAMICPFEPGEKQALLECSSLGERGQLLVSLLDMAVLEADAPAAGTRH
ncbi:MAG: LON peptidase substrate-binding domain-containing protein [Rhodospirillales bacterium]